MLNSTDTIIPGTDANACIKNVIKYNDAAYKTNPYSHYVSFYAIGVVTDIFATGKNLSLLQTHNTFEWGINSHVALPFVFPDTLNIGHSEPPPEIALSSSEFFQKFIQFCLLDIRGGEIAPQWIITNLCYVIGYAVCHLEWTNRTITSCKRFLGYVIISQHDESQYEQMESIMLENLFFLEQMKPNLSSSSPFLDRDMPKEDISVLKLALLFHRYDLLGCTNQDIRLVKDQLSIISEPLPDDLMAEIQLCVDNLLSESKTAEELDLKDARNWFRKSPSKTESLELENIGLQKYSSSHESLDSTLVAQHLKRQLLKISMGLIPESICNLLLSLVHDELSESLKGGVWLLLSLSESRFKVIQMMLKVTNRIKSESDIQAKNLATVILVHQLKNVDENSAMVALREEIERWNQVWGLLIEDNAFLINNAKSMVKSVMRIARSNYSLIHHVRFAVCAICLQMKELTAGEECQIAAKSFSSFSGHIPSSLVKECMGMAILRGTIGVAVIRLPSGEWSAPCAIALESNSNPVAAQQETVLLFMTELSIYSLVTRSNVALNQTHIFEPGPFNLPKGQDATDIYVYVRFNGGFTPSELIAINMVGWIVKEDSVRHSKWHGDSVTWFDVLTNKISVDRSSVGNALYVVLNLAAGSAQEVYRGQSRKNFANVESWVNVAPSFKTSRPNPQNVNMNSPLHGIPPVPYQQSSPLGSNPNYDYAGNSNFMNPQMYMTPDQGQNQSYMYQQGTINQTYPGDSHPMFMNQGQYPNSNYPYGYPPPGQ